MKKSELDKYGKGKWEELKTYINGEDVSLVNMLIQLCSTYSRWNQAKQDIETNGTYKDSPNGYRKNPSVEIERECTKLIRQISRDLGIWGTKTEETETNPIAEFTE